MANREEIPTGAVVDLAFGTPVIADLSAPTVAEVTALTRFECWVAGDAPVTTPRSGNTTDLSSLCDVNSFLTPTTVLNDVIQFMCWRYLLPAGGTGPDDAWNLFDDSANPKVAQDLVIARGGFSGAGTPEVPAAGDIVDVYRTKIIVRAPEDIERESGQMFRVELAPSDVQFSVTIAA